MNPCAPPAKKARIERFCGGWPNRGRLRWKVGGKLISGKDASRIGLKPSDVLALQRTLMKYLKRLGSSFVTSGA